ncbi:hypothetical protein D0Z07_3752 [Hyphodiscus hymeniophilus]|uniref:Uncharacterized protein n=1 Tax=Hyphodiscus hymeniophilus TaxID=353542 RepID=A0A9P6VLW3_9HELO|nr:hypothetical protein D0Z07_3752 [Hyphodiscus hymeniophilus]
MAQNGFFENFDDDDVYRASKERSLDESTRNFVVEFGKSHAQIGFDLCPGDLQKLFDSGRDEEKPVRWMYVFLNIWAPNRQVELIELLGNRYKFSPRLLAIIQTMPPDTPPATSNRSVGKHKGLHKDDIELAISSVDTPRTRSPSQSLHTISQYDASKEMINFQSIDIGAHCANWMHELPHVKKDESILDEGSQRRLWFWLVLCDDNTVMSLHEDPGPVNNVEALKSMRGNTLSVLSQLSIQGHLSADPTSMITVRQALGLDAAATDSGTEGSSNLFYYLFDDWRAVYSTIAAYRARLRELEHDILADMTRKSGKSPNIEIIPRLHVLGRRVRQMEGLYSGYKNLITRIIESKPGMGHGMGHGMTTPRSLSGVGTRGQGVVLAPSATQRFERLGDRLDLLILSGTREFLAEKDALISMYFNINTQKDSEATARLTRSATLLAKLSVLFLPVSLMTSYFSTQISDIQDAYTVKEYWIVFAVMMSISFMGLFFFSRLLMWVTETLDEWVKEFSLSFARIFTKRGRARQREVNAER